MIVVLNGPLGAGKSTLAELLAQELAPCATVSGDALVAVAPPARDEDEHLHAGILRLVAHHREFGYPNAVIEHLWTDPEALRALVDRLREGAPGARVHCIRLTLGEAENLARIRRRASVRAVDELAFELDTVQVERRALEAVHGNALGIPVDASGTPAQVARRVLAILAP